VAQCGVALPNHDEGYESAENPSRSELDEFLPQAVLLAFFRGFTGCGAIGRHDWTVAEFAPMFAGSFGAHIKFIFGGGKRLLLACSLVKLSPNVASYRQPVLSCESWTSLAPRLEYKFPVVAGAFVKECRETPKYLPVRRGIAAKNPDERTAGLVHCP
jgi:hypothetical protein